MAARTRSPFHARHDNVFLGPLSLTNFLASGILSTKSFLRFSYFAFGLLQPKHTQVFTPDSSISFGPSCHCFALTPGSGLPPLVYTTARPTALGHIRLKCTSWRPLPVICHHQRFLIFFLAAESSSKISSHLPAVNFRTIWFHFIHIFPQAYGNKLSLIYPLFQILFFLLPETSIIKFPWTTTERKYSHEPNFFQITFCRSNVLTLFQRELSLYSFIFLSNKKNY